MLTYTRADNSAVGGVSIKTVEEFLNQKFGENIRWKEKDTIYTVTTRIGGAVVTHYENTQKVLFQGKPNLKLEFVEYAREKQKNNKKTTYPLKTEKETKKTTKDANNNESTPPASPNKKRQRQEDTTKNNDTNK